MKVQLERHATASDKAMAFLIMATPAFEKSPKLTHYPGRRSVGSSVGIWENGAGEGIRTLDPNLGKVVLYP